MKTLKIVDIYNYDFKKEIKYLVVDNEVFDWGLDPDSLSNAVNMINHSPDNKQAVLNSIINHFIASFSEFLGRDITLQEINESIETGII